MQIIEREEVNTGRQAFIDIAKVFAILGMICSHFILLGCPNKVTTFPIHVIFALTGGVFAAPVFMFSMGIGLAYSRRSTPEYIAHRGIDLTIKAWLLNIARGTIPVAILYYVFNKTQLFDIMIHSITILDILHFAGLAFLVFALFKKLNFSAKTILWISIGMALIATFCREFTITPLWLKIPVGYFMGITSDSNFDTAFPLFHWFIFVASGYYFGGLLKHCSNVDKLFTKISPFAFIIFILYSIYAMTYNFGLYSGKHGEMYYHMHILDMAYSISAIFTMFAFCQFISKFLNEKVLNICNDIGKNLNEIYIQQWIYIGWSTFMLVHLFNVSFRLRHVFVGTIVVFVISALLAHWFRTKKVF